jgi:hypothetical protein
MPDTVGGFNDLVQLSQDTLYVLGEELIVGNSAASTVTIGFSNTGGILALAAAQTANETIWLPLTSGTLLVDINVSAGTTSNNLSNVVFSNSYNVSFGLNGSTVTANAQILVSAAGFQVNATQISFSNNNLVTFGVTSNAVSGAVISASIPQPGVVLSAGAAAAFATEFVFSNSNGISFGLNAVNGSVITASYTPANLVAAGTQTGATGSTILFSNSNGVTFGMSNSSVVTASANTHAIIAGTQTFTTGSLSFANSNGFSFGMSNSSVVTLDYGGFSSWSNGKIVSSFGSSNGFLSLNPIVVDYAITATNAVWLANFSGITNSSGVISFSLGVYTLAGGTTGTLNLASSSTSAYTWTSGAPFSSQTGLGYRQMSLNSWQFTPGLYVFAFNAATTNSASMSLYGIYQLNTIVALASQLTNLVFPGLTQASTAGLPAAISVSNTSGYIRSGSSVFQQPWLLFQGT